MKWLYLKLLFLGFLLFSCSSNSDKEKNDFNTWRFDEIETKFDGTMLVASMLGEGLNNEYYKYPRFGIRKLQGEVEIMLTRVPPTPVLNGVIDTEMLIELKFDNSGEVSKFKSSASKDDSSWFIDAIF